MQLLKYERPNFTPSKPMIKAGKYIRIVSPWIINILSYNDKKVTAMAYWPFILFRHLNYHNIYEIENHELIHHQQQKELLVVPFYLIYFLHFLFSIIRFLNYKKAYYNVCFEKEAYAHEKDFNYLKSRKWGAWFKYL
jgi:hypothetical protein